jgi:hypothetical protein
MAFIPSFRRPPPGRVKTPVFAVGSRMYVACTEGPQRHTDGRRWRNVGGKRDRWGGSRYRCLAAQRLPRHSILRSFLRGGFRRVASGTEPPALPVSHRATARASCARAPRERSELRASLRPAPLTPPPSPLRSRWTASPNSEARRRGCGPSWWARLALEARVVSSPLGTDGRMIPEIT